MSFPVMPFMKKVSFDPLSLNPALWLDGLDADTITEDTGKVSQWDDKSGNGNHAIQPTAGRRAVYEPGNNRLFFDLASMYGDMVANNVPVTIFVVYSGAAISNNKTLWGLHNTLVDNGIYFQRYWLRIHQPILLSVTKGMDLLLIP